jgi:hypothetical protein
MDTQTVSERKIKFQKDEIIADFGMNNFIDILTTCGFFIPIALARGLSVSSWY